MLEEIIISYLVGSIPFAVVIAKVAGLGDITQVGSGNPGATNMVRLGGKKFALLNLILDAGKGALMAYLFGLTGLVAAVVGHCFSIFLKFKGGKGVATFLGGLLGLHPLAGLTMVGLWLATFGLFRISALSALVAINLTAIIASVYWHDLFGLWLLPVALLITFRHKSNILKMLEDRKNSQ